MKLISLSIEDFKGLSSLRLELNGKNAVISGNNGTGKTTIADAYHWVLFGKDSQGKSEFDIKPLDENNRVIPGKIPIVQLTIEHQDKKVQFRKEYAERWTKPRGSVQKVLSGHTVKHYVDGVPVKKRDYERKVAEIINSDLFRLLSDLKYFNEILHWKERRDLLLKICGGNLSDLNDDVINSDEKFASLLDILDGLSPENCLEKLKNQRKVRSGELETLPARIDEVFQGLPKISDGFKRKDAEVKLAEQRKLLQEKEQELALLNSGDGKIQLRELELEISQFVSDYRQKVQAQINMQAETKSSINQKLLQTRQAIREISNELESRKSEAEKVELRAREFQQRWDEINMQPVLEEFTTCPVCLQDVPEFQLEKVHAEILKKHNLVKAKKLEEINKQEKQLLFDKKRIEILSTVKTKELQKAKQAAKKLELELAEVEKNISLLTQRQAGGFEEEPEYQALQKELEVLKSDSNSKNTSKIKGIALEIERIRQETQEQEKLLLEFDSFIKGQKRIRQLQDQEKGVVRELERLESEIALIEEFNRAKIEMLEDKINSSFSMAKFKLFEEQVNGTIIETCETLYEGVSYNSTLNDGAKVNVDLDIINKFGEYYGFTPPIFFDNAESVTKVIPTNGQLIRLVVTPVNQLTVTVEPELALAGADAS